MARVPGEKHPRLSLGKEFTDFMCFSCAMDGAQGLIDKHGGAYVSCRFCKVRSFGLSIRAVASLKFISNTILQDERTRRAWAMAVAESEMIRWRSPLPDLVAKKAKAEAEAAARARAQGQEAPSA